MRIIRQCISVLCIIAVCLGLNVSSPTHLAAQEPTLSQPATEALGRLGMLKTYAITWTQQYQSGEPGHERRWSEPRLYYLVWQDGKMYTRFQEGGKWTDDPKAEMAFNGQIFVSGWRDQKTSDGRPRKPAIIINLAKNEDPDAEYFGVESLQPLGIHLPRGSGELLQIKHLQSQLLFLLDHSGRLKTVEPAQIDGRQLTRTALVADNPMWDIIQKEDLTKLEKIYRLSRRVSEEQIQQKLLYSKRLKEMTPRKLEYVFYLDQQFGYTVRRYQELTEDGRLQRQADCTKHVKLPGHEIWLPRKCQIDSYTSGDEIYKTPYKTDVLEISEFDTKPVSDELFTLKYTAPGTEVTDRTLPEAKLAPGADVGLGGVTYRIPASPEDLDRTIEEARALNRARAEAEAWRETIRWIMLLVSTVLLAGVVGYIIIRYRRRVARS